MKLVLRVILRNEEPLFYDDRPSYRLVSIDMTPEQIKKLEPRFCYRTNGQDFYEEISHCFLERVEGNE